VGFEAQTLGYDTVSYAIITVISSSPMLWQEMVHPFLHLFDTTLAA